MRQVVQRFGAITGRAVKRRHAHEPEQLGERRVTCRVRDDGLSESRYHAPSVSDPDFFPLLVLDAVLTGAKGLNLWASFRTPPPQRSARLYRALVDGDSRPR
jgi:zinc protease